MNANVLPFVASLHSKSYFSSLEKGYQSRVATWFYSGSSFYFNVLVKFSSLAPLFQEVLHQYNDIQAFTCNWTTSTFLILNFGFGSLN